MNCNMRDIFKTIIMTLCVIVYGVVAFYNGELPIKNPEELKGWLITIGFVSYFFL